MHSCSRGTVVCKVVLSLVLCGVTTACGDRDVSLLEHVERAEKDFADGQFPDFRDDHQLVETVTLQDSLPALTPPFPARVSFSLHVPSLAHLEFFVAVVAPREAHRARVEFAVTLETDGERVLLYREAIRSPQANRWHPGRVDLSAWGNETVDLVFETRPALGQEAVPWAGRIQTAWGKPTLVSREERAGVRTRGEASRPSFVILLVDALRPDYLGVNGFQGEVSPMLDRLAAESVRFENCFSPAPWTKPAIASLFTSLYPEAHGVTDHPAGSVESSLLSATLPPQAVTLAEVLREDGYQTAAFLANPWLSPQYGLGQGFETYEIHQSSQEMLDAARAWLAKQSKPFFLYLHFMDVHGPYEAPRQDFEALLASPSLGPPHKLSADEYRRIPPYLKGSFWTTEEEDASLRAWRARYAAGVRAFDRTISPFLDELRNSGTLDEAYLVLTSDHGEELLEHGSWEHGFELCVHQLHVPLFIRKPLAVDAGQTVNQLASLVDLMPSILSLAEIDSPPGLSGQDLSALLDGQSNADSARAVFASATKDKSGLHAIRTLDYHMVWDRSSNQSSLFAVDSDPQALEDLAESRPEEVAKLRQRLLEHLGTIAARGTLTGEDVPIPEELRRQLKALGYLQ